jgi:hypothetical protein
LEKQLVIAGYEAVKLFNDSLILHFIFVVSKDTQLLQEVKYDEK